MAAAFFGTGAAIMSSPVLSSLRVMHGVEARSIPGREADLPTDAALLTDAALAERDSLGGKFKTTWVTSPFSSKSRESLGCK